MTATKPLRCPVCGTVAPLHAIHITTLSKGVPRDARDLIYMCAYCHAQLDQGVLRAFEFEVVLADLMQASDDFTNVKMEGTLGTGKRDYGPADIVAKSADGTETIVVECKGIQTIGEHRLREALEQLKRYRDAEGARRLVLALPARVTAGQKAMASSE